MVSTCAGRINRVGARLGGRPLCAGSEGSVARSDIVPEAGMIGKTKKRINTKYGLDIHYYRSAAAGSGVALL